MARPPEPEDPLDIPPIKESTGQQRWRRRVRLTRWSLSVAVAILLIGGVIAVTPAARCGNIDPISGLRSVDGECVGVTDGSFVFDPEFADIQRKIKAENDWVAERHATEGGTPAVKVAMLSTLTPTDGSPLSRELIRRSLEGAYVALHRANRSRDLGGPPLIQLYLANEGSVQQGWEPTVDRLIRMTEDDIPLSIVMGQGISTDRTTAAAHRLAAAEIPMVTGTTTADGLDHDHVDGLIRAAASNTDAALAIRRYLDGQKKLRRGVLVYDTLEPDTFAGTLRAAMKKHLDPYIRPPDQLFQGSSITPGGSDVFDPIVRNICGAKADMAFFAGRAPDMEVFLKSLEPRNCVDDQPLTVFFVDIGLYPGDTPELRELLDRGKLTVLHATGYDPRWARHTVPAPKGFAAFEKAFHQLIGGLPAALDDGYAATMHDSMAIAVRAVRINVRPDSHAPPPPPQDVRRNLLLLHGKNSVQAATGTLEFNANRGGNPGGKHVPIVPLPGFEETEPSKTYVTPVNR